MFFKTLVFALIGLLALGGVFLFFSNTTRIPLSSPSPPDAQETQDLSALADSESGLPTVRIGEALVYVEFARTPSEMSRGLSGRRSLPENNGMFFVYDAPGFYHFWMPNMYFSIDIIWLDENYIIVDITHDLSPDTYPETFTSSQPAQYVLEVNAGWARLNEVSVGMQVLGDL